MRHVVSTHGLLVGIFIAANSVAPMASTEESAVEFDLSAPANVAQMLEPLSAENPPSAFSIEAWPDLYGYQPVQNDDFTPDLPTLEPLLVQSHTAPDTFQPSLDSSALHTHLIDNTRTWLSNPDIWPTYVIPEAQETWIDSTREYLHAKATVPVVWFDDFFAVTRGPSSARHDLRLTPKMVCSDLEGCEGKISIRSRITLPHTQRKLKLLLTNEDPDTLFDTLDRRASTRNRDEDRDPISAALSWAVKATDTYNISISSGLQLRSPLRAFIQASSVGRFEIDQKTTVTAGQSLFYRSDDGLGGRTQIDLDHSLREDVNEVFRWRQRYDMSEVIDGLDIKTSFEYLRQVTRDKAWGVGYDTAGNVDAMALVESHKTWFRYRKRFYREWLFWELEPFVQWKREFDFKADPGIEFSIEVYLDEEP